MAQVGEFDRAVEALERVLRLDPSNGRAHYNLGLLAVLSDAPDGERRARRHFQAAIESDPAMTQARVALANLLWRHRECRAAIPHFERYLAARAGDVQARMKEAICHAHLGDYDRALALLEAGYRAFPDNPVLQDALVRVLAASPDPSARDGRRALAMAERLVSTHRSPETLESLAMAYAETGRYADAVRAQEEVLSVAEARGVASAMLEHLRANLERYEESRPCRTPWPPTVFDQ